MIHYSSMGRPVLVDAAVASAAAIFLLGCGSHDRCAPIEVHLAARSSSTSTYTVSFLDASCEVFVPGSTGFGIDTPESVYCASEGGQLRVDHLDPNRPDCTPDLVEDDSVRMGNCWNGAPMTRLIWLGPRRLDETLALRLSGPTERTVDVPLSGCNHDPMQVDLSE
jgi:putative hemolysin